MREQVTQHARPRHDKLDRAMGRARSGGAPTTSPGAARRPGAAAAATPPARVVQLGGPSEAEPADPNDPSARPDIRVTGVRRRRADAPPRAGKSNGRVAHRRERIRPTLAPMRRGSSALDPDAKKAYETALAQVQASSTTAALEGLNAFLVRWPDHPYAENAMYWRGEAYFAQGEYLRAAEQFDAVIARFGSGNKAPDALLKLGMCHDRLGALATRARVLGSAEERVSAQRRGEDAFRAARWPERRQRHSSGAREDSSRSQGTEGESMSIAHPATTTASRDRPRPRLADRARHGRVRADGGGAAPARRRKPRQSRRSAERRAGAGRRHRRRRRPRRIDPVDDAVLPRRRRAASAGRHARRRQRAVLVVEADHRQRARLVRLQARRRRRRHRARQRQQLVRPRRRRRAAARRLRQRRRAPGPQGRHALGHLRSLLPQSVPVAADLGVQPADPEPALDLPGRSGASARRRARRDRAGSQPQSTGGSQLIDRRRQVPPETIFLRNEGFIDDDTNNWGEISGSPEEKMILTDNDEIYLRIGAGHDVKVGQELTIYRPLRSVGGGKLIEIQGTATRRPVEPEGPRRAREDHRGASTPSSAARASARSGVASRSFRRSRNEKDVTRDDPDERAAARPLRSEPDRLRRTRATKRASSPATASSSSARATRGTRRRRPASSAQAHRARGRLAGRDRERAEAARRVASSRRGARRAARHQRAQEDGDVHRDQLAATRSKRATRRSRARATEPRGRRAQS